MPSIDKTIITFIKNPEKGKVKTRIGNIMGHDLALRVYEALLTHTRNVLAPLPYRKLLFYSMYVNRADQWDNATFQKHLQLEGSLGEKMKAAFRTAFDDGSDQVIIIGSDCPQLSKTQIEAAWDALRSHDIVIGPAVDGGYYLLGMKRFHPSIFENITWSSTAVLYQTIERIKALDLSYQCIDTLSDVDYWEDWQQHGWAL